MAKNPFKAFAIFRTNIKPTWLTADRFEARAVYEPSGSQWRSIGFAEPQLDEWVIDLEGTGSFFAVQFNERILPAAVRDKEVKERVVKLAEQTGRKPGKKEYAELREQVEFDLLPKAFIRRSTVYAHLTTDSTLIIFSSSARRIDDVLHLLTGLLSEASVKELVIQPLSAKNGVHGQLRHLAMEPQQCKKFTFAAGFCVVLKGEGKSAIRVKDKNVESDDIQKLIIREDQYEVHELGVDVLDFDDEVYAAFVVTAGLRFKAFVIPGISASQRDDFVGFAVVYIKTILEVLPEFMHAIGGEGEPVDLASIARDVAKLAADMRAVNSGTADEEI